MPVSSKTSDVILGPQVRSRRDWRLVTILGIAAIAVWLFILISGLGYSAFGLDWNFENTADLGDSFGPLNTILTLIAAISAYWAYRGQEEELDRLKAAESSNQESTYKRDFENTFFQLLDLLRSTVGEMTVREPLTPNFITGRRVFGAILEQIGPTMGDDLMDEAQYRRIYQISQAQLGHYFRLVYQIVRFVDESNLKDKKFYTRLLRATFSNDEIVLIGLNGWHGGFIKTRKYIENYSLLNNITASEALSRRLVDFYKPAAFGKRDFEKEKRSGVLDRD